MKGPISHNPIKPRRGLGRPRALTLLQVIAAGTEIGLANLSISAVAMRLGVGIATIYTYVDNLEALRRLVAIALSERPTLVERGQHWADIVREHAAHTFGVMSGEPDLLVQVVSGALGPGDGFNEIEAFLRLLVARGFTVDDAFELHRASGQITAGASVSAAMAHVWKREGASRRAKLAYAFAETAPDHHPLVRTLGPAFTDEACNADYRPTLERLLASVAAERGEALPLQDAGIANPADSAREA